MRYINTIMAFLALWGSVECYPHHRHMLSEGSSGDRIDAHVKNCSYVAGSDDTCRVATVKLRKHRLRAALTPLHDHERSTLDVWGRGWNISQLHRDASGLKKELGKCGSLVRWRVHTADTVDSLFEFHVHVTIKSYLPVCVHEAVAAAGGPPFDLAEYDKSLRTPQVAGAPEIPEAQGSEEEKGGKPHRADSPSDPDFGLVKGDASVDEKAGDHQESDTSNVVPREEEENGKAQGLHKRTNALLTGTYRVHITKPTAAATATATATAVTATVNTSSTTGPEKPIASVIYSKLGKHDSYTFAIFAKGWNMLGMYPRLLECAKIEEDSYNVFWQEQIHTWYDWRIQGTFIKQKYKFPTRCVKRAIIEHGGPEEIQGLPSWRDGIWKA